MKLSEAILMGDSLKKANPHEWLSMDGSCGCAIGGAILAMGKLEEFASYGGDPLADSYIQVLWPWLADEQLLEISALYTSVYNRRKTIEQLCAYVRSIEPAEPEPLPEEEFTDEPAELAVYRGRL